MPKWTKFIKMHGIGNDFVIIDDLKSPKPKNYKAYAREVCDRRKGIGCDQLLILKPSKKAAAFMEIFNSDGSHAQMCGNGLRCVAKYLFDGNYKTKKTIDIDTPSGIRKVKKLEGNEYEVDMGEPVFNPALIPLRVLKNSDEYAIVINDLKYNVSCISLGNPHCVLVVEEDKLKRIKELGPKLEKNSLFPQGTNVELVHILDSGNINVRVWERGAGETLACGSGAAASMIACRKLNLVSDYVNVHMAGGSLKVKWEGKGNAFLSGEASFAYSGEFQLENYKS